MKICFVIAEYNPFHLGHMKLLDYIRENVKPDAVAVIMSGNFTQRGKPAVLDKYERAVHAVYGGADIVIELPTVFATAPAEIFAKGAVRLISSVNCEKTLCFGTESAEKEKLISTAKALLNESKEFKKLYRQNLAKGYSPVKAKTDALAAENGENIDVKLLESPNNILAAEYAKAALVIDPSIELIPVIRQGAAYDDDTLHDGISSASAIRKAIAEGKIKKVRSCVPKFTYDDLNETPPNFDDFIVCSALKASKRDMKKILDCNEGLENRIKSLAKNCSSLDGLMDDLKTKRYTYTRLSRILLSNALGIDKKTIASALKAKLYLKVLAVKKDRLDVLSELVKNSEIPVITRKSDVKKLGKTALRCFEKDVLANDTFNYLNKKHTNEFEMKII